MSMMMNPRQADEAARRDRRKRSGAQSATLYSSANPSRGSDPSETTQKQPNLTPAPAPAPVQQASAPRPLNYRDAAYNAQISSIQRALEDYETGATTRAQRYGQDFTTGLRGLGYRPGEGFDSTPNVFGAERTAPETPMSGQFDIEGQYDPYSAAAQGTRSRRDDFAARGTLRSSDFAKTFGQFQDRLQQQLDAMETSRTRFGQDLATDVAQQRTASQERQQGAQRDAMLRAAVAAGRSF